MEIDLIADLHDAITRHGDHELADNMVELAGYPARDWLPTCPTAN